MNINDFLSKEKLEEDFDVNFPENLNKPFFEIIELKNILRFYTHETLGENEQKVKRCYQTYLRVAKDDLEKSKIESSTRSFREILSETESKPSKVESTDIKKVEGLKNKTLDFLKVAEHIISRTNIDEKLLKDLDIKLSDKQDLISREDVKRLTVVIVHNMRILEALAWQEIQVSMLEDVKWNKSFSSVCETEALFQGIGTISLSARQKKNAEKVIPTLECGCGTIDFLNCREIANGRKK